MAYVYQPYPRWMFSVDGTKKVVQSADEEAALGASWYRTAQEAKTALDEATKPKVEPGKNEDGTAVRTDAPPTPPPPDAKTSSPLASLNKI